jgi:Domain of unknown function (DUF4338)
MYRACVIQGRLIGAAELATVRELIAQNPTFSRYKLSRALCERWNWRDPTGQIKDMAARTLLGKLEQRGWIDLPAKRRASPNRMRHKTVAPVDHETDPISGSLCALTPLQVRELSQWPEELGLYEHLLSRYHYLSYTSPVGLNLKYLVLDRHGRPLSCLLFGSAAWKCAVRDQFIGWTTAQREVHLQQITNNTRFIVLPWVRVSQLASHVLSQIVRRLRDDWRIKYSRPLALVETFVDTFRFTGSCYRAANWTCVGQTSGRTRQDRWNQIRVAPKWVMVYPLSKDFRQRLSS